MGKDKELRKLLGVRYVFNQTITLDTDYARGELSQIYRRINLLERSIDLLHEYLKVEATDKLIKRGQ